ncbi:hypothetical protein P0082_01875 [Candidatus Haliotispira prima]|uniref:Uncharacterized protein n=1 Tax=Candidatus Haliotispira prima TaxID=3034016 RepID=A0ABY8MIB2_9SPIO|nr:hypothetical protein P0082_01875 [Candidatus Haliotispira prima]
MKSKNIFMVLIAFIAVSCATVSIEEDPVGNAMELYEAVQESAVTIDEMTYTYENGDMNVEIRKYEDQPYLATTLGEKWLILFMEIGEDGVTQAEEMILLNDTDKIEYRIPAEDIATKDGYVSYQGTAGETDTIDVELKVYGDMFAMGNATLRIEGTKAYLDGLLGVRSYVAIKDMIEDQPEVKTIVLGAVPGSLNDQINMPTGLMIREAELNTELTATSAIASGGTDLFASGVERVYTEGATIGVHSWCCVGEVPANEVAKDDPAHGDQLDYFREILGEELGPEFYFYTLESAEFDGMHTMTREEIEEYSLATSFQ